MILEEQSGKRFQGGKVVSVQFMRCFIVTTTCLAGRMGKLCILNFQLSYL